MTVQELYELTQKKANPRKVEIRIRPHDDEISEVEFQEDDGEVFAYLVEEGAIQARLDTRYAAGNLQW